MDELYNVIGRSAFMIARETAPIMGTPKELRIVEKTLEGTPTTGKDYIVFDCEAYTIGRSPGPAYPNLSTVKQLYYEKKNINLICRSGWMDWNDVSPDC